MRHSNFEDKRESELWLSMFAKLVAKGAVRISRSGSKDEQILQNVVHNDTSDYIDKSDLRSIELKGRSEEQ